MISGGVSNLSVNNNAQTFHSECGESHFVFKKSSKFFSVLTLVV